MHLLLNYQQTVGWQTTGDSPFRRKIVSFSSARTAIIRKDLLDIQL
jgi:hypothetical protein